MTTPIQFTCTHCGYVASTEYGEGLREQIARLTTALAQAERERDEKSYLWKPRQRTVCTCFHVCPDDREQPEPCRHELHCELELEAEVERLKDILRADGLDSDMPIPPGLNLRMERAEAALARVRAALETAANRLDIAASVIRSGAKFARWADEARAALEGRG